MNFWRGKDGVKWRRILSFATVYFFLFLIHVFIFTMSKYFGTPEAIWYLQHPLETLRTVIFELGQGYVLFFLLFLMAFNALILGFITDLIYRFLRKYIQLRMQRG
ncbi:MAG: hypothetical protein ACFE95_13085 [Candidatus Hodarchaeota archaeon]